MHFLLFDLLQPKESQKEGGDCATSGMDITAHRAYPARPESNSERSTNFRTTDIPRRGRKSTNRLSIRKSSFGKLPQGQWTLLPVVVSPGVRPPGVTNRSRVVCGPPSVGAPE